MKYYIKQKVFSFTQQFNIMDEFEVPKYQVKGKFMSLRNKLELLDDKDQVILRAERALFTFMPLYMIYDTYGTQLVTIKRRFALTQRFTVDVRGHIYEVEGNIFAHEFSVLDQGNPKVYITKKWLSWGDTYEIDIIDEDQIPIWLFLVIVIDQVNRPSHTATSSGSN